VLIFQWLSVLKLCREVVLRSGVAGLWERFRSVAFMILGGAEEGERHLPVMSQVKVKVKANDEKLWWVMR
jgi:hypothetical protein